MCVTIYVQPHFKTKAMWCHVWRKNIISQYVSDVKEINNPMTETSDRTSTNNAVGIMQYG